jgi:hypothetical protein
MSNKYREEDDFVLRVNLKDGEHWDYTTTHKFKPDFKALIEMINSKLTK